MSRPIVFFDLETTGKDNNPDKVRIIEICAIKVDPVTLKDIEPPFHHKCNNDGVPIDPDATARNGVVEVDIADCPTFQSLAKEAYDYFDGCDVGGYYCSVFDIPILYYSFLRAGITWDYKSIKNYDIYTLYRKYNSGKLGELYKRFTGKDLEDAHTADADTRATILVYDELRKRDGDFEDVDLDYYSDYLDIARNFRVVINDAGGRDVQINFGKWKGISVNKVDRSYFGWMLEQDFPPDTLHYARKIYEMKERD